jgi:hypothetical protein
MRCLMLEVRGLVLNCGSATRGNRATDANKVTILGGLPWLHHASLSMNVAGPNRTPLWGGGGGAGVNEGVWAISGGWGGRRAVQVSASATAFTPPTPHPPTPYLAMPHRSIILTASARAVFKQSRPKEPECTCTPATSNVVSLHLEQNPWWQAGIRSTLGQLLHA